MAIQAQINANQTGIFPGSSFINNNGYQQQQQHNHHRTQSFVDIHMEKQRLEINHFIRLQNERLRYVLQEQRKQEMEMILKKMETRALVLMKHKEEEMLKALNKNMELEDLLRKMEMENLTWQRMARENEAMVVKLNSTIQEVQEKAGNATCHVVEAEDEGSFCCGEGNKEEEEGRMSSCCWNCGSNGETRVLFLPCRHLCCCVDCEDGLVVCPMCNMLKKNRIEAFVC